MLGFLFGPSKVNEELEALLKSIEEIEKEIEEEKSSLPEIIPVRDSRSAWSDYAEDIQFLFRYISFFQSRRRSDRVWFVDPLSKLIQMLKPKLNT